MDNTPEGCTHDCGSCSLSCGERSQQADPKSFLEEPNELSSIKRVIGVVSGKGGVGKSMVTSMMAVLLNRRGYHTGILDADVTGPSIPKAFGIHERAQGTEAGLLPAQSKTGVEIMSVNMLRKPKPPPSSGGAQ